MEKIIIHFTQYYLSNYKYLHEYMLQNVKHPDINAISMTWLHTANKLLDLEFRYLANMAYKTPQSTHHKRFN